MQVRVAVVVPRTEAEGPGLRWALWVQGCPLRCVGCCNPEFFEAAGGTWREVRDLAGEALGAGVEGVTFLGGEPFAQAPALAALAQVVRAGGLSVMIFSGYTLAELRAPSAPPGSAELLAETDLLVDGRFEAAQRSRRRRWIGSDNQALHFLSGRYHPDDPRFLAPDTVELHLDARGVTLNGLPILGARTRL